MKQWCILLVVSGRGYGIYWWAGPLVYHSSVVTGVRSPAGWRRRLDIIDSRFMWMYEWRAWPQTLLTALLLLPSTPSRGGGGGGVTTKVYSFTWLRRSDRADWQTGTTPLGANGFRDFSRLPRITNAWTACERVSLASSLSEAQIWKTNARAFRFVLEHVCV